MLKLWQLQVFLQTQIISDFFFFFFVKDVRAYASANKTTIAWNETELILFIFYFIFLPGEDAPHVYLRAWALGCFHSLNQYPNHSEGDDRVGGEQRGDKECLFSGVTNSGRVWRKVPESDAWSVMSGTSGPCWRCSRNKWGKPRGKPLLGQLWDLTVSFPRSSPLYWPSQTQNSESTTIAKNTNVMQVGRIGYDAERNQGRQTENDNYTVNGKEIKSRYITPPEVHHQQPLTDWLYTHVSATKP